MVATDTPSSVRVNYTAEHRSGKCKECGNILIQDPEIPEEDKIRRNYCPKCGSYSKGELISCVVSVQPPNAPVCLRLSCLLKYFRGALLYALLASYHRRRVTYAEANRHEKILERYRSGDPSPKTVWQAIHANIKLTCPVCRKYNVDPFLKRRK